MPIKLSSRLLNFQEVLRRIKQLEAALGRKNLESKVLKEAVDFAKAKKGLRACPCCPGSSRNSRVNVTGRIEQKLIDQKSELNLTSRFPAITNFGLNYQVAFFEPHQSR